MIDVGSVLADRYELRERIGVGGMGEVYRAFDRELEREVAIKSLLPHLARDEDLVGRFRREARTIARVRHPGIIALFDMLRLDEGALYIVLELVPGRSLEAELEAGPLPWARCVDIGSQICGALAAAHAQEVIHRDIKPSNILLEPNGLVRVADFGIARLAGASKVTRAGMAMGTPGYWAPEQALGEASSPQTDIYAVGTVLFHAATGRMPFVAVEEGPATALLNVTQPVPDPREADPGLPADAAAVIMRAMAKAPAERWGSAVEMASALRATLGIPPVTPADGFPVPQTIPSGTPATIITPPPPSTAPQPTPPPTPSEAPPTRAARAPDLGDEGDPETERGITGAATHRRTATDLDAEADDSSVGRRLPALAVAVVVALVAAAGGLLASGAFGGSDTEPQTAETVRVRAGAGSLEIPGEWRSSAGGSLPGLPLASAATARPMSEGGGRLVAGLSAAVGPTLLPASFLDRLEEQPGRDDRVALGDIGAYRYQDLAVEGVAAPVTLFVAPTDRGVQTVACVGPEDGVVATCEGAAASLRLSGGAQAIPLGPDAAYARTLAQALTRLDRSRVPLRTRLAAATTPAGQAAAAANLVAAHTTAAAAVDDGGLGPEGAGLDEAVASALRAQAAGYSEMAAGARDDAASRFATGRRRVDAGEGDLAEALDALRAAGYPVEGG